jgi:hypothetical protein
MTKAVGNITKQAIQFAGQTKRPLGHGEILFHMRSADVVNLAPIDSVRKLVVINDRVIFSGRQNVADEIRA